MCLDVLDFDRKDRGHHTQPLFLGHDGLKYPLDLPSGNDEPLRLLLVQVFLDAPYRNPLPNDPMAIIVARGFIAVDSLGLQFALSYQRMRKCSLQGVLPGSWTVRALTTASCLLPMGGSALAAIGIGHAY